MGFYVGFHFTAVAYNLGESNSCPLLLCKEMWYFFNTW